MNREYELKKFIRLLKDAGAYSEYFRSSRRNGFLFRNGNYSVKEVMLKDSSLLPSEWLSSYRLFTSWSKTKQGASYWAVIHMIWTNLLKTTKYYELSSLRFEIGSIKDKVLKQRLEKIIKTYKLF